MFTGYTVVKLLGYDEGIKRGSTGGKVFGAILGNLDIITLGVDIGTELGFLDGSFYCSNESKLEGSCLGDSQGYTDGKVLGSDEGTFQAELKCSGLHVVVLG